MMFGSKDVFSSIFFLFVYKFLNFHIPIPPYDEQKIIADYITDKVNHIGVEIDKRNKLVEKYQEYKKSLIYEVVTGKKEV